MSLENRENMMDNMDKRLINAMSTEFPLCERPYEKIANALGITEQEAIDRAKRLQSEQYLRRVSVALFHTKIGFACNIMVVWDIDDKHADEMGKALASHSGVSHCYKRLRLHNWRYNLYTMVHARSKEEAEVIVEELKALVTFNAYAKLYTSKELKKTGMKYFPSI